MDLFVFRFPAVGARRWTASVGRIKQINGQFWAIRAYAADSEHIQIR